MATIRQRGNVFEVIIKRKKMLGDKPVTFTCATRELADLHATRFEALLDQGIIPPEIAEHRQQFETIGDVIRAYLTGTAVSYSDRGCLEVMYGRIGSTNVWHVSYQWVEGWIAGMKREFNLSPSTIRHHVGALARCFDWGSRRGASFLIINPIRLLPKRYSTYTPEDIAFLGDGMSVKFDVERDRRLSPEEEQKIRDVLSGNAPVTRQRDLNCFYRSALQLLFDLALESAMRLGEIYTLRFWQIVLAERTIFLEKTKNGSKRQVPITTVAEEKIKRYYSIVASNDESMQGFSFDKGFVFPWWDGDLTKEALDKTTSKLSKQFARICEAAGVEDFVFHDLRHEATSRIFERTDMDDVEIMKITGHKSKKVLARYANLRGCDLAAKMW